MIYIHIICCHLDGDGFPFEPGFLQGFFHLSFFLATDTSEQM